ncbi:MAG: MFS transporter [Heliomarina sp.]|uniref:MFS transporter n=1 Tax=Heliomarina sp. TaxID=2917556 RepID=UPI00405862B5
MLAFFKDPRAVALLLAASLTILSNTIISPALPGLQASFPDNPNAELMTRLLVTAPSLLVAFFAPFAGMVADRFGRRRQILVGALLFSVAGCAGTLLPSLETILVSRLFLGLSVAMVMTGQAALIGDYFDGEARGKFMGLQIAVVNFSGFAFIALSGWLAGMSPRLPFLIYALGAVIFPYLWFTVKDPVAKASTGPEVTGENAGSAGWVLTLVVIVTLSALSFVLFYLVPTQIPFYLATIGFDSASAPAQVLAMVTLAGGATALAFGRIHARLGHGLTPACGFLFMACGFGLLDWVHSMALIDLAALCIGAGFGLTMPTFFAVALNAAPAQHRGLVSGAITTSIFLGQFISPIFSMPMVGAIGYEGTFGVAAIILVVTAVLVYLFFQRRGRSAVPA